MRKILFLVPVLFFWSIASASIDTEHLVISQVQITGGSGKTTYDFVEIFNPTSSDIDLKGMRLVKRTKDGVSDDPIKSWTETAIVKAGRYYLWANNSFTEIAATPDVTNGNSIANDNGIALRLGADDTGTIIDSVAWGNAANIFVEGSVFSTNPGIGQSLVRTADTDNNAVDFVLADSNPHNSAYEPANPTPAPTPEPAPSPEPTPTPSPTPSPQPQGGGSSSSAFSTSVIISEIFPNPDGKDDGEEWIELVNQSNQDVNLVGWIVDDEGTTLGKDAYIFPTDSVIKANSFLVIHLSPENFALNNTGGEMVRLFWPDKTLASSTGYTASAKQDQSYALLGPGNYAWTTIPTPGTVNLPSGKESALEKVNDTTPLAVEEEVLPQILITEVFPEPKKGSSEEEFVELLNVGDFDVDLTNYALSDNAHSYKLQGIIKAHEYLVIKKSESKLSLNNSGSEVVTLASPNGTVIDSLAFENAPGGQSYNLRADETYAWSTTLTAGKSNQITSIVAASSTKKVKIESEDAPDAQLAVAEFPKAGEEASTAYAGTVSGSNVVDDQPAGEKSEPLWPWLAVSFAVNMVFCYSLVKLMTRKGNV